MARVQRQRLATQANLARARGQLGQTWERRSPASLANEMNMRISAMGIVLVPANPWNAIHGLFGTRPEMTIQQIAAHVDCDVKEFNEFMGRLSCELSRFDGYVEASDFALATRYAREG